MDEEILTASEAAHLLKVDVETVVEFLKTSELPGRKIAGEWRTTRRALVRFIDGIDTQSVCCPPGMCCPPTAGGAGGSCC